ncbi:MAG TPA: ChbG/HpnK family deacetylase [Rhizobacter sp.]|nr:ChbG/HpnK family deacetylase [Rhizobacter sp.]
MSAQLSGEARRLAVCVDDFGLNEAVDRSAFELAAIGRISAVSCLVEASQWHTEAGALRSQLAGRVDLGLHLNFTELLPGGQPRHAWPAFVALALARQLDTGYLRRAIERQLDAFARVARQPPDFLDGHRHVHQLPVVRELALEILERRGWRVWWRSTRPAAGVQLPLSERAKAQVIGAMGGRGLRRLLQRHGQAHNRHLLGVYGFAGSAFDYSLRLAAWLDSAQDGDLLMCHPAAAGAQDARDPIAPVRCVEHAVLSGTTFPALLAKQQIRIERLSVTLASGNAPR